MSASDGTARDSLDGQEPVAELFGTVFGLAEEIASQVSPSVIEARLRRTVRRAARPPGGRALAEALARSQASSGNLPVPDRLEGALAAGWDGDLAAAYAGHYTVLVRLAALLAGDVPAAEEAVQDAFAAMHGGGRRRARGQDEALACLRQAVVNWSRSAPGRRLVTGRVPAALPQMPGGGHGTTSLLERSAVVAAVRSLPPRQREALVLRYYADLSEAQAAAAMGVSRRAVKKHTARAMTALRSVLEQQA